MTSTNLSEENVFFVSITNTKKFKLQNLSIFCKLKCKLYHVHDGDQTSER